MLSRDIGKLAPNGEVDYLFMKHVLRDYAQPRAKITALLRSKQLIRVKKGLYVLDGKNPHKPFVKETLANLIYGPSYISLEYALAFYGFIPERVEALTSVTNKKDKLFKTPLGVFSYRYLNPIKYCVGITQLMYDATHPILIATPEKALTDQIILNTSHLHFKNLEEIENFLFEDLRIPLEKVMTLDRALFDKINAVFRNKNIHLLNEFLKKLEKNNA
ncbi:MAG: hypothetical protein QM752_01785 [Gammaproteobacteria bacterium]